MKRYMSKEEFETRFGTLDANMRLRLDMAPTIGQMNSKFKESDNRFQAYKDENHLRFTLLDETHEQVVKELK